MSVNLKRENGIIVYEIDQDANTYEIVMAKKDLEKNNQILGLIRNGDDLLSCSYPVQTMYEININDNNYTISNSIDAIKLRTLEKIDDLLHESIITIDFKNNYYYVLKYIHTLKHSTIEAKTYSNVDGGNLSFDEAKDIILSTINKSKSINIYKEYINIEKIETFFKEMNINNKLHN